MQSAPLQHGSEEGGRTRFGAGSGAGVAGFGGRIDSGQVVDDHGFAAVAGACPRSWSFAEAIPQPPAMNAETAIATSHRVRLGFMPPH